MSANQHDAARNSNPALSWFADNRYRNLLFCGIALQVFFWVFFVTAVVGSRGIFSSIGGDFGFYWAAAHAFRTEGPLSVYDLATLERFAEPLMVYYGEQEQRLRIGPVVYPPVFLVLLQPLTLLQSPLAAFIAWTLVNLGAVALVGHDVAKRLQVNAVAAITCLVMFYPIANSFFVGQPGGILLLGMWKGMTSLEGGRPLAAGAWFGILLLKPNYLPLLVVLFLVTRKWNMICGIALAGAFFLLSTVAILGARGSVTFVEAASGLGLSVEQSAPSAAPDMMPTWRGVMTNLLVPDASAGNLPLYLVGALGILAAFVAIAYLVQRISSEHFVLAMFGTMLVTFLVNPHTHIHALNLLAAPAVFLMIRNESRQLIWLVYALSLFIVPVAGIASLVVTGWITWVAMTWFAIQLVALCGVLWILVREHRFVATTTDIDRPSPVQLASR